MDLSYFPPNAFISLLIILGVAFVAFIVDFLKGTNEQLRALSIELKVRREEEQRHSEMMTAPSTPSSVESAPLTTTAPTPKPIEKQTFDDTRVVSAPFERKRAIAPEALAAMERGAQLAGAPRAKAPAPAVVAESTKTPVVKKDWSSLLARRNANAPTAAASAPMALVASLPETVLDGVPAGFHEGYVLTQLVKSKHPVSGLVVSIGVTAVRPDSGSTPNAVKELIQSLIGPADFACQSSPEEFLLICPSEQGAGAQRRLNEITETLWNFQLRSMGNFSILFSWGGVEVRSESIDEAIISANERMKQTRRGRKLLMMERRDAQPPLRQAV